MCITLGVTACSAVDQSPTRAAQSATDAGGGTLALKVDVFASAATLMMPWHLAVSGNTLAVLNPSDSAKVRAFDIRSGREISVVYRGPKENYFRFPSSISAYPERDGLLIVGDPNANRLTRLQVHNDTVVVESDTPIVPKLETPFRGVTVRHADAIVLTGVFPHATIRELDSTGLVRRQFGPRVDSVQGVPMAVAATLTEQLVRWDAST